MGATLAAATFWETAAGNTSMAANLEVVGLHTAHFISFTILQYHRS